MRSEIVVVVVTRKQIQRFLISDLAASTAAYYALLLPFHSQLAATAGSLIGAYALRRWLRGRERQAGGRAE